jgi:hypothetical protein
MKRMSSVNAGRSKEKQIVGPLGRRKRDVVSLAVLLGQARHVGDVLVVRGEEGGRGGKAVWANAARYSLCW